MRQMCPKESAELLGELEWRTLDQVLGWLFFLGYWDIEIQADVCPTSAPTELYLLLDNIYRMLVLPSHCQSLFPIRPCHLSLEYLCFNCAVFQEPLPQSRLSSSAHFLASLTQTAQCSTFPLTWVFLETHPSQPSVHNNDGSNLLEGFPVPFQWVQC